MSNRKTLSTVSSTRMPEAAGRAVSSAETRLLELQGENRRLRGVLSQLQDDQRDIYYFLQKKLDDDYEVISALEQKIINWQVTQEATKRQLKTIDEKAREFTEYAASTARDGLAALDATRAAEDDTTAQLGRKILCPWREASWLAGAVLLLR